MSKNTSPFFLFFIFIILISLFCFFKKKQDNKKNNPFLSKRKEKDEVWKAIKQFLKNNNEVGKEIVDSYVVKRNHIDAIDSSLSSQAKKNKKAEIKIRKWQIKNLKKNAKKNNSIFIPPKVKINLYVVVFITKNIKTNILDAPRCFEVEVVNKYVEKNKYDNQIIISSELDYYQELKWIAPIRENEKFEQEKTLLQNKILVEKIKKKKMKKLAKKKK